MEHIPLPKIEYMPSDKPNVGTVVLEPLYPGYGTTIGSALRRILLSSLPGAAVTAVKIENAPHEFTTIPKVKEDILEIILNLKRLRLKLFSEEPVMLHLKVKGEKAVTAADIEKNSDVEIVNPDLLIATLTGRDAELVITLTVSRGRGFVPTETREKLKGDIGSIAVDALFSPVRRVAIHIEGARVGQMTNFDKLVLEIETDGTIDPHQSAIDAAKILIDHFALFAPTSGSKPLVEELVAEHTEETSSSEDETEEGAPKKKRAKKKSEE